MNLKAIQIGLAHILAAYMRLVRFTTRWTFDGHEHFKDLQKSNQGFVVCAWHSRFLMTTAAWSKMKQKPYVLISRSRDGNLVAYTSLALKLGVIRGSRKVGAKAKAKNKDKRGAGALREMVQTLKNGDCIFMTPDGPRGPRMRMGEGPLRLAKLSGTPVLAYALSTSNKILFNSWDRFMLPLPFGRGKIIFAEPLYVPTDADDTEIERLRLHFENVLNTASQNADIAVGNAPILPAEDNPKRRARKRTAI
ncbi:MAG: hypothetical protein COA43_02735 [Robiginitomaculum sp.]|nr:MAG: hypothetical protein COA43_02735 [Robiginitomaculum sp.]